MLTEQCTEDYEDLKNTIYGNLIFINYLLSVLFNKRDVYLYISKLEKSSLKMRDIWIFRISLIILIFLDIKKWEVKTGC